MFNVGDRVSVNRNCVEPAWIGLEGTVLETHPKYLRVCMDRTNRRFNGKEAINMWREKWTFLADEPVVEEDWT